MQLIQQSEPTAGLRSVFFKGPTGLTVANAYVHKAGSATPGPAAGTLTEVTNGGATLGMYHYAFTTTECNSLGPLCVVVDNATEQPGIGAAMVVPNDPYANLRQRSYDVSNQRPQPEERYLTECSTQTAYVITGGGRYAASAFDPGGTLNDGATGRVVAVGSFKGARITFFGLGADNSTFTYRVYLVKRSKDSSAASGLGGGVTRLYCTGTATLSALTGEGAQTATAGVRSTERLADTLTKTLATSSTTPKGSGATVEKSSSASAADLYSPGSDAEAAYLEINDLQDADGIYIDFDLTGATGANALVELKR